MLTSLNTPVREAAEDRFHLSVDEVSETEWHALLAEFKDASFYQTWAYGRARWGDRQLSHAVLKQGSRVVALAQLRLTALPLLGAGVAYIPWGPAWQRRGEEPNTDILREMIRALRKEYVTRRKLLLRVFPNAFAEDAAAVRNVLAEQGFLFTPRKDKTLVVDLSAPLDKIRAGFRRSWRQTLGYAEKRGIEVIETQSLESFDEALRVYRVMHQRKQFSEFVEMELLKGMQASLPEAHRMRVVLCRHEGETVSALIWSVTGETGLPVLAATTEKALPLDAANLMWWQMISWLKLNGYAACDLGGINQERNPGGYTFKSGMARTHGREVTWLGQFDACESFLSALAVKSVDRIRSGIRDMRLARERKRRAAAVISASNNGSPEPAGATPAPEAKPEAAPATRTND